MKNFNYKKAFYTILVLSLILIISLSTVIYLNIDYIMFKYFITSRYLYTDTLESIFDNELGIDINSKYYKYFDNIAIEQVSKLISFTGNDPYTYQFTPKEYTDYVAWRETKANIAFAQEINTNSLYMLYPNFTNDSYSFLISNIDLINKYDNLVLDLRGNGGGDLDVLFDVSGLFVGNDQIITIEKTRTYEKHIASSIKQSIFVTKIIILMDASTASASESLIVCLKEIYPNTITVGSKTYGKGIGQTRINLTKDFYSKATTLEWLSPNGVSIHKVGIIPDYPYIEEDILDYIIKNFL